MQGHPLKVVPLDYFIQVDSKNLKHKTEVVAIGSLVYETVEETDHVGVILIEFLTRIVRLEGSLPLRCSHFFIHHLQYFDLIIRSIQVMWGRLLDLQRHIILIPKILRQPDSGEMPPSQFLDDNVAVHDNFSDVNWVVPT